MFLEVVSVEYKEQSTYVSINGKATITLLKQNICKEVFPELIGIGTAKVTLKLQRGSKEPEDLNMRATINTLKLDDTCKFIVVGKLITIISFALLSFIFLSFCLLVNQEALKLSEKGIIFCPFSFVFLLRQTTKIPTRDPHKKTYNEILASSLVQSALGRWCFFFLFLLFFSN